MSQKLLVISDLHAHTWPRFSRTVEGVNPRVADLIAVLDQAVEIADRHHVSHLVMLGDLFHRRHFISWRLFRDVSTALMRLVMRVKSAIFVVGNHDLETDDAHALEGFRHVDDITIVDAPTTISVGEFGPLHFVPYSYDEAAVASAIGYLGVAPLFAHFAASGVPLESGYHLDSVVPLGSLTRFPYVVFGHVHRPVTQCAGCRLTVDALSGPCPSCGQRSGRVIYVGAPMHFDFGDQGPRFVLVIDSSGAMERVPIRAPRFVTAQFPLVPRPPADGGYLRLQQVPVTREEEVQTRVLKAGWRDVVIELVGVTPDQQAQVASGLSVETDALVIDYVKRHGTIAEAEREALTEVGLGIIREVR